LLARQQHVDEILAVFETRWNRKLAAPDWLQGVPHYDYARKSAALPPSVATFIQIVDYAGTVV
jgi:hypothetical protein